MLRKFIINAIFLSAMSCSSLLAAELDYSHLEIGRSSSDMSVFSGNGFEIDSRIPIDFDGFLNLGYRKLDFSRDAISSSINPGDDLSVQDLTFGVNGRKEYSESMHVVYGVGLIRRAVDVNRSTSLRSENDIGIYGEVMVRSRVASFAEVYFGITPFILDDDSDLNYSSGAVLGTDRVAFYLDYTEEPVIKTFTTGLRMGF